MSDGNGGVPARSGTWDAAIVEIVRYLQAREERERKDAIWTGIKRAFIGVCAGGFVFFYVLFYANAFGYDSGPSADAVALIPIAGAISTESDASADAVIPLIEKACKAEPVKHLILHINSPGGAPNESERIVEAIEACRAESGKKVIALIDGVGASAAYMIAVHADEVVAGRYSLVGSVGAIMRYVNASEAADKIGLKERIFRSGVLKGGPGYLSHTDEAMDNVNQEMVSVLGRDFLNEVYEQREGRLKAPKEEVFTGRVWTAPEAEKMGLIDRVATLEAIMRTDFEGLKLHRYATKTPFAKGFGMEAWAARVAKAILMDLETPEIQ